MCGVVIQVGKCYLICNLQGTVLRLNNKGSSKSDFYTAAHQNSQLLRLTIIFHPMETRVNQSVKSSAFLIGTQKIEKTVLALLSKNNCSVKTGGRFFF